MSVSIHVLLFKQLPSPGDGWEGGLRQSPTSRAMCLVSKFLSRFRKFKSVKKMGIFSSFSTGILDSSNLYQCLYLSSRSQRSFAILNPNGRSRFGGHPNDFIADFGT